MNGLLSSAYDAANNPLPTNYALTDPLPTNYALTDQLIRTYDDAIA